MVHHGESGGIVRRRLLPLPDFPYQGPAHGFPPRLNLAPERFFVQLADHYLFAILHQVLYASLLVENRMRLEHMENAVRRLDHQMAALRLRYNAMRQEEITNEIEVIMLSVEALAMDGRGGEPRQAPR